MEFVHDDLDGTSALGARPSLRVGDWLVDPQANTLTRGAQSVRIEPKAMDVLVVLADRAGRVVSRDELFEAAWPGVVVGDEALSQSIIKLRRAMGDSSRAPTYIETVAKRGYRLIAPVRAANEDRPASGSVPVADGARPRRWGRLRRRFAVPVLAALAGLGAIVAVMQWPSVDAPPVNSAADASRAGAVTVSVVPFDSLDLDRAQDYVARGVSDILATELSRIAALRVIHEPAGSAPPSFEAARYRITGSVQRAGSAVRINVRVTDSTTGEQVWAGRIERPASDPVSVQDALAAALVDVLPATVTTVERQRLARRYTTNADAFDDFLKAQALFLARRPDANEQARALYRAAVERDPQFARAYAGLAMTYAIDDRLRGEPESATNLERAFTLAETARAIDPELPQPYWALGFVHAQRRRHDDAAAALRRAIELDPSFADAWALLGGIETYVGRPATSIPLLRTAMRLNPDAGYLYYLLLGRAYLFENDTEQALINLRAAASRNPADLETRLYLAAALAATDDRAAARWEADEVRALAPAFTIDGWLATYPATSEPHVKRLRQWLATAGL